MPLLNGDIFVKKQPPDDLDPEEEIFFSPITYEIFRDYDEFFERTILLNSLTWNCNFCGKGQLTYTEAQVCEKSDENQLSNFGTGLSRGLLHIMLHAKRRRLTDLVDLLIAFAAPRYFVGEKLSIKRPDNSLNHFVVVQRVILPSTPTKTLKSSDDRENTEARLIMPNPHQIKYVVRSLGTSSEDGGDYQEDDELPTVSSLILPTAALQRSPRNPINRDRIKFFIRQTGQLDRQIFVPRKSILTLFNLHPQGALKWGDIFANPEPKWPELTPPRGMTSGSGKRATAAAQSLIKSVSESNLSASTPNQKSNTSAANSTWDAQRLIRLERVELERAWSLLRKRDDLELSDLVPLPSFKAIRPRRLPLEEFGVFLQVFEFYNVFGEMLNLPPLGQRGAEMMSWTTLEAVLFSRDPMGPLGDVLMALLAAIRRLEAEANGRQLPPTAEAAAASAVSAIATLEADLPLSCASVLTGLGSSQEYSTMLTETLSASPPLAAIYRASAEAARQSELCGIPPTAGLSFGSVISRAERAALALVSVVQPTDSTTTTEGATVRSSSVRACATACTVGAASLPAIDRAGLAETLWLHVATAPAKAGGWRGGIWGGTRPRDDPSVEIMMGTNGMDVLKKLRTVSIYSWPLKDRLTLITSLMDELLMQPQLRDAMESGFESLRQLRLHLRSIQAERYKLYGGNSNSSSLYGFSPSTLISSCDNWLTGTPPILRNSMSKPRKKTAKTAKGKNAAEYGRGSNPNSPIVVDGVDSDSQKATGSEDGGDVARAKAPKRPPIASFAEELSNEERELWYSVLDTARRCSMIPLGQDRINRRYWLVMSLPAVLIEDTQHEMTSNTAGPTSSTQTPGLHVRSRQVDVAATLGSSAAEAANRLGAAIEMLFGTEDDEAEGEAESDQQWQNPRLLDRDSLLSQLSIDLPPHRDVLPLEQMQQLVQPARRAGPQADSDHPAVVQVEQLLLNAPRWSVLLPVTGKTDDEDRYSGAKLAVSQLEASLNPRGTRESHLRKSICQLRPILVKIIADCPFDQLITNDDNPADSVSPCDDDRSEEILLSWLESTIDGVAARLGVPKSVYASREVKPEDASSEEGVNGSDQSIRLRKLASKILDIGSSVSPRRLAAPLGSDDRSLRVCPPNTVTHDSRCGAEDVLDLPTPSSSSSSKIPNNLTTFATNTGYQRWRNCVAGATTTSQLHLLVRALERSARRANRGGRGVPAAIASFASRFRLPEARCTACRGLPDNVGADRSSQTHSIASSSNSEAASTVAFALCGGCACPFHADCLSNARARRSIASTASGRAPPMDGAFYALLPCHITSATTARQELLRVGSVLCPRCRAIANNVQDQSKTHFPPPGADEIVEAKEEEVDQMAMDDEATEEEAIFKENIVEEEEIDEEVSFLNKSLTLSSSSTKHLEAYLNGSMTIDSDVSSIDAAPRSSQKRGSCTPSRPSRRSLLPRHSTDSRRSGKRPRYLEDYDNESIKNLKKHTLKEDKVAVEETIGEVLLETSKSMSLQEEEVLYEDEEEAYSNSSFKPRTRVARRQSTFERKHLQDSPVVVNGQAKRRGRPSATRAGVAVSAEVLTVDCRENGSLASAERLLADISGLSAARPLLRCALSKTIQSQEMTSNLSPVNSKEHGHWTRKRRSTPGTICAYDLEGLRDALTQGNLPGGPSAFIPQLRLLIKHWMSTNRPGSRLHGCAQEILAFLEKRLAEVGQTRTPLKPGIDNDDIDRQSRLPK